MNVLHKLLVASALVGVTMGTAAHAGGGTVGGPVVTCGEDEDDCPVDPGTGDGGTPSGPGSTPGSPGSPGGTDGTGTPATPNATSTLDFTGLTGVNGTTFSTLTENGYVASLVSGNIMTTLTSGAGISPALYVNGPLAAGYVAGTTPNQFAIARTDGGAFTIDSLQVVRGIEQNGADTVITLSGYIDGALKGTSVLHSQYDGWFQPIVSGLTTGFDRVVIDLNTFSSSAAIDNIVLTQVAAPAVPEPATWAMMLAGFGMIGFAARRRPSVRTRVTHA